MKVTTFMGSLWTYILVFQVLGSHSHGAGSSGGAAPTGSHTSAAHNLSKSLHKSKNYPLYFNSHGTCDGQKSHEKRCCNMHNVSHEEAGWPKEEIWCKNQKNPDRCEFLLDTDRGVVDDEDQEELDEEDLLYFLVVFVIIGYGAVVRSILKVTNIPLPYTVILMLSGFGIGFISREYCHEFQKYTAIARTPPAVILFTFLPVLIFESAFSIPVHTFMRSAGQIVIAAFPGMMISTFSTAGVCLFFLQEYNWSFTEALLFGAIISATDPVAVVAILRELGTSEMLSVMIEGESLLNDGVAILMYKVFEQMLACELEDKSALAISGLILKDFIVIAIGGPAFGYLMARIAILCLSKIFNDATVEITITLAAAYLTYFIGDHILSVSGVMAVVALGLVMGSERTCISPEVEESVHHFWEMLGYLANTVLFVLVGIVISETSLDSLDWHDLWYLGFLYIALNIIRLVMLMILMPILQRMGYGLRWENMIVMMWGGLRGAVGLCLAIEVFRGSLCEAHPLIGPKFLFQTAGIVVLTLVVNGTTTKILLETLKLTEISPGRIQDMANAVKQIVAAQVRTVAMLKHDRFLADANWKIVEKYTSFENPYIKQEVLNAEPEVVSSILSLRPESHDHVSTCDACHHLVKNEHTNQEIEDLTEEGRLRLLKALKVSYWRQFEQGVLTELAVLTLVSVAERVEDKYLSMVHARDFRKHWTIHGPIRVLRKIFLRKQKNVHVVEKLAPKPKYKILLRCWKIATNSCFDFCIMAIIILNLIPIVWELVRILQKKEKIGDDWERAFNITNYVFTSLYTLEFIIKVLGLRQYYFKSVWNWIDFIVLAISWIDVGLKTSALSKDDKMKTAFQVFKLARILRIIRLPRHLYPKIKLLVEIKTNEQLFLGYDVGKGFVNAIDDVLKYLPQMVDNPRILNRLKRSLDNEKLETVRQMGLLHKEHPGIAIAVKTRHASRAILNMMRDALTELKEDGLVDEKENELLTSMIEHNMKRLWSSPSSIPPSPPHVQLGNISWVIGNEDILAFMHENAELRNFSFGDKLYGLGDAPDGVFLIVSGMVKIAFSPSPHILSDLANLGKLPNTELFVDLSFSREGSDFFSTGTCIGEVGALTGATRASSVTCETFVMAYHIPQEAIETALEIFHSKNGNLESRMWRSVGINIGTHLLPTSSFYQGWSLDKVRMHLERSAVPMDGTALDLEIPEFVSDIVLIQGKVRNVHKSDVFVAPGLLPRSCVHIVQDDNTGIPARVLVVAIEDVDHDSLPKEQQELHAYIMEESTMHRRKTKESRWTRKDKVPGIGARRKSDRRLSMRKSRVLENRFRRSVPD